MIGAPAAAMFSTAAHAERVPLQHAAAIIAKRAHCFMCLPPVLQGRFAKRFSRRELPSTARPILIASRNSDTSLEEQER